MTEPVVAPPTWSHEVTFASTTQRPIVRARRWNSALLLAPAILTLLLGLSFHQGLRATDDMGYAEFAMQITNSEIRPLFQPPHHHGARLGLTFPLAAVFSTFGPSDIALTALPLIATVATAILVTWLGLRIWGPAVGLAGGLVFALFPPTANLATFYVPEPILNLELSAAAALVLVALRRAEEDAARPVWWLDFLAGVLIGLAYTTTEVGAVFLPACLIFLAATRRLRARHLCLVAGFFVVVGAEWTYQAVAHGHPLYRFGGVASYLYDPMVRAANEDLTYRLFKAYPKMFISPSAELGLSGPLLIAAGIYGVFKWREAAFLVIWAAVILLFYNFMTASFTSYVALPVASRLVVPACVPLCILAGKLLHDVWTTIARVPRVALRWGARTAYVAAVGVVSVAAVLAGWLGSASMFTEAIAENAKAVSGFLADYPGATIVTDRKSARAISFYREFRPTDSYRMLGDEMLSIMIPASGQSTGPRFVVVNDPVVNERAITGGQFGGNVSLREHERAHLESLSLGDPAFNARPPRSAALVWLLRQEPVRLLAGDTFDQANRLASDSPRLSGVRVYRVRSSD